MEAAFRTLGWTGEGDADEPFPPRELAAQSFSGIRSSRSGHVTVERRRRDAEAVRDLYHASVFESDSGVPFFLNC
jgi:hypothetical protein